MEIWAKILRTSKNSPAPAPKDGAIPVHGIFHCYNRKQCRKVKVVSPNKILIKLLLNFFNADKYTL